MIGYFRPVLYSGFHEERPLVWVLLNNLHNPLLQAVQYRALIDTGATQTLIPYTLCQRLGHDFEKGTVGTSASGVGGGAVQTSLHATRLAILSASGGDVVDADDIAFAPFDLDAAFVEQQFPFILFGQRDFLKLFRYTQHGKQECFRWNRFFRMNNPPVSLGILDASETEKNMKLRNPFGAVACCIAGIIISPILFLLWYIDCRMAGIPPTQYRFESTAS
jgi:hypothetical protein